MKKNLLITICFLIVLSIYSCKDDTKPPIPAKTKTDLLCNSLWKLTAATVDPGIDFGGTLLYDIYTQLEDCTNDDLTKFERNKTGIWDEGPTKCDQSYPQSMPFTWTFDLSETKLTMEGTSYEIIQLDETTLKYSQILDGIDIGGIEGLKYKFTSTYKHP